MEKIIQVLQKTTVKPIVEINRKKEDFSIFFENYKSYEINKKTLDYFREVCGKEFFTIENNDDRGFVSFANKCADYIAKETDDLSFLNI